MEDVLSSDSGYRDFCQHQSDFLCLCLQSLQITEISASISQSFCVCVSAEPTEISASISQSFCVCVSAEPTEISASINLLGHYGLEHSYNKYFGKKVKEELSSFLPHLPGNIDTPGIQDNRCASNLVIVLLLTPSLPHLPGNIDTPSIWDNRCASNLGQWV